MPLRERIARITLTRRRAIIVAAVAAAIVLFVVVPAYLSSLPGFFGRYPALNDQYTAWSTSTHAEVGCEQCHVSPAALARIGFRMRMAGEFYISLVAPSRQPAMFSTPTNASCVACHSELRTSSPEGDLQIPHRAHITILQMECVACHSYLVHEPGPDGRHTPSMEGCLTCHDGDTAKDACTACHTAKAAPESHSTAEWLVEHALQADDPECAGCHEWKADWCADCHRSTPRSHTAEWRAEHGDAVARHRSCEACHTADFCAECHGDVPQLNYDPTLELVR